MFTACAAPMLMGCRSQRRVCWLQERPRLVCQVPEAPQVAVTPALGKGQPQCRVLACSGSSLEVWELPLLSPEVQGPRLLCQHAVAVHAEPVA